MTKQSSSFGAHVVVRSLVMLVVLTGVAALSSGLLRGSMPDVQTGTWVATGNLSSARSGAASVLLPAGGVLVTGGEGASGALETVDLSGSDGSFSPAASMNEARSEHTAVLLKDGRVLVVGGRNANGAVGSAEVFADGGWTTVAGLTDARWGHTATVLKDGRVLVAGGENAAGAVMSLELFDPETGVFAVAGTMAAPREGHAAALLTDGRVIIAGGATDDAALATTEIFDPESLQLVAGPSLNTARDGLTATTLLDGRVVFIGGHDGTQNIASAEIYSDVTNAITYTATATPMVARRNHQAFLLPNNNAVLIVGGIAEAMVDGAVTSRETSAAELYLPWRNEVWQTSGMTAARAAATGAALSVESYGAAPDADGLLLVAGGGQASSEAYRFATIRTDKDDYSPGMKVYVSGSGWQPNETVTFALRELPAEHASRTFEVVADEQGRIDNAFLFDVEDHHLGVRFYLTARGAASQAQTTFTDAVGLNGLAASPATAIVSAGQSTSYTVTATFTGNGTNGCNATLSVQSGLPVGATASWAPSNQILATSGGPQNRTLTIVTSGATPTGSHTLTLRATAPNTGGGQNCTGGDVSTTVTLQVQAVAISTTTTASNVAATYGDTSATLTASVVPSSGPAVGSGTVTFTVKSGTTILDTVSGTVASGAASASFPLSAVNAGTYSIEAVYNAGSGFSGSNNASQSPAPTLTVAKANPTVTATGGSFTYTGSPQGGSGTATGVLSENLSPVTVSYAGTGTTTYGPSAAAPTNAGTYTVTASFAGNDNYNARTSAAATLTINKATATISVTGYTVTYDGQPHTATGTATGVTDEDLGSLLDLAGTTHTNAGIYPADVWTFAGNGNYQPANGTVDTRINQATATISVTGYTVTYDGQPHTATGTATGVADEDLGSLLDLAGTTHTNAGIYPADVWTFAGNGNYQPTNGTVDNRINQATATISVTGYTVTYDGQPHTATGTATGVADEDLGSLLDLAGTTHTNAGIYPADVWTFAGNGNYQPTNGTVDNRINQATATIVVNGYTGVYDGNAHGATGTVQGVQGETLAGLDLGASFTNVPGGTANWTFTDVTGNYNNSNGSVAIVINKANATVVVQGVTVTYDGNAHGATGTAKGVKGETLAGLNLGASFTNVPGGTATWTFTDVTGNYNNANGTVAITITPRNATVTADDKLKTLGEPNPPLTATVTGTVNGDVLNYTLATTAVQSSPVGSYPITVTPGSNPNYNVTTVSGTLRILFRWDGFLQPINDTAHDLGTMSKFKLGQTIPAKFQLKNAAGAVVQQSTLPGFRAQRIAAGCTGTETLETPDAVSPDNSPVYKWDGTQYHYNWSTKGLAAGLYKIYADLADGTAKDVTICIAK